MNGIIRIHHQDAIAEYTVTRAQYGFIGTDLYLEIDGKAFSQDCITEYAPGCSVALDELAVGGCDISACVGREFTLPTSQNDAEVGPDRFTNLYLNNHFDIDENHIRFYLQDGEHWVEWRGVAPDVIYYGKQARNNPIEMKCRIGPGLFPPKE